MRALGAHEVVDVDLGDDDVAVDAAAVGADQDVFHAVAAAAQAVGCDVGAEFSVGLQQARFQELRHDVDDAGAADALRLFLADGEDHRLAGGGVDADLLDGAEGGAHAVPDAAALEGGAGGAGRGDEPLSLPTTISPLVPISMKSVFLSRRWRPEASTPATMSPPT